MEDYSYIIFNLVALGTIAYIALILFRIAAWFHRLVHRQPSNGAFHATQQEPKIEGDRASEEFVSPHTSPFAVLGLAESATVEEIKQAYRRLALLYHPNRSKNPQTAKFFEMVHSAYEETLRIREKSPVEETEANEVSRRNRFCWKCGSRLREEDEDQCTACKSDKTLKQSAHTHRSVQQQADDFANYVQRKLENLIAILDQFEARR